MVVHRLLHGAISTSQKDTLMYYHNVKTTKHHFLQLELNFKLYKASSILNRIVGISLIARGSIWKAHCHELSSRQAWVEQINTI